MNARTPTPLPPRCPGCGSTRCCGDPAACHEARAKRLEDQ